MAAEKKLQKLELTWIGKGEAPRLEPRILIENPEFSYSAAPSGNEDTDNLLIHGDNLLALKALETDYAGKVKCIYIDPPYNTGSAFEHYDDGVEHSQWLNLMKPRLTLLRNLLSDDGSIWISIDDNECHYLKVLCDEVFGRRNFVSNVIWEKSDSPRMDAVYFSTRHDYILNYAKNKDKLVLNRVGKGELPSHYDKVDENGAPYYLKPLRAMGGEDRKEDRPSMYFSLRAPDGTDVLPKRQDGSDGRWRWGKEKVIEEGNRIDFVKGRDGWSVYYRIYGTTEAIRPPETIWKHEEVGSNRTSKAEVKAIFGKKTFDTPKPEALIEQILTISTQPGDLVLDSFLGSGTTAAVAHKMGRRWIGIELGEHAKTHCYPRLKAVVDGEPGGISKAVGWKGGGGFKFYTLAPSLLNKDSFGNWVISKEYNPDMLAAALARQEGFQYAPDGQTFWKQGRSSEGDFIYTTTHFLSHAILSGIAGELGADESLLVCCTQYEAGLEKAFPNINIQKIPAFLLRRCEFGRDDYSLTIINSPLHHEAAEDAGDAPVAENSGNPTLGLVC